MDFSETYRYSGPSPAFSPDGRYIAVVVEYRLLVRDWQTLRVVQLYSCLDKIQHFEWSSDSNYILCGLYDRAIVQVWSVEDPEWTCKIDEGPAGITGARWCPDARSILVTADFQLKATIWSLTDRQRVYIKGPKFADKGIAFSPDGEHLVVTERKDCKDFLIILTCSDWKAKIRFQVDTFDLSNVAWSPRGDVLAVWDNSLNYKILLYSMEGKNLGTYSAYEGALGIKSASWSPAGEFISVGSFDQMLRLLNNVSWEPTLTCPHQHVVSSPASVVVYKELEEIVPGVSRKSTAAKYVVSDVPVSIPNVKPPMDKPDPKLGVGLQAWSGNGRYLATRNDNMPSAIWVWEPAESHLVAVLLQKHAVKCFEWEPESENLAVCCGTSRVYMWSPAGASVVHIPLDNFQAVGIKWSHSGSGFVMTDAESFCVGYIMNDDE
ncbi:hypothetical protein BSKO_01519 [Bryopsis sp. KO-2023]|nr:hypothetical protein BSKO_01519 [Bryopsis sp. KO-2023]